MSTFKQSRRASFALIAVVYILAIVVGVLVYRALPSSFWLSLFIADIAATVFTFAFSVILGNASVYDPYWSVAPPVIVAGFILEYGATPLGVLYLVVVSFWALRLTANWAYTFGGLTHQDWRYTMLREKTGVFYPIINLVGIHLVPTLVVWGCVLPAVYAIKEGLELNVFCVVFLLVSVLAAVLQGTADYQMHKFRRNRSTPFIRTGLWKYSRHPNYLGEILMWWGVALAAIAAVPSAWYLTAGALANTMLFLFVSIPLADGRQARKEGFEEYKAQTRMLLPIRK